MSADSRNGTTTDNRLSRRDAARQLGGLALASLLAGRFFGGEAIAQTAAPATQAASDLQGAGFFRTTINGTKLTIVSDGQLTMDLSALFDAAPDAMAAARKQAYLRDEPYPGHLNTLLVEDGTNRVLIDTGYGTNGPPTAGRLKANLARAGVTPESITHVFITHAHPDHIGGLLEADGSLAFSKAPVLINEAEYDFWMADNPKPADSKLPADVIAQMAGAAKKILGGVKGKLEKIGPGTKIGSALVTVGAPGHTPGHLAAQIGDGENSLLYVTDAVHVRPLQFARPDMAILYDADRATAMKTRQNLLGLAARDRLRVSGAHIAFPALGYVESRGESFGWVPDTWTW